jgi:hypothetical protein
LNTLARESNHRSEDVGTRDLTSLAIAFLIAVPLAWAVLLLFHGAPDADDIYGSLRGEATEWMVVHLGTLVFVGLVGVVLYLLVRDLPGTAARISRLAVGPFVLFYGAGEALLGIGTGVLVEHANGVPAGERPAAADAIQALWSDFISDDLLLTLGSVAWVVAVISAAVAYRRIGSPLSVSILLGLSAIVILHTPPFGPIGLVFFAVAVVLIARSGILARDGDPERAGRAPLL